MDRRCLDALAAVFPVSLLLAACATAPVPPAAPVPEALKPPPSQALSRQLHAAGVQVYECQPGKDDATRFEWSLRGPEAELSDGAGKPAGKHYAGPTWEAADGSKVVGAVVERDKGPDANAIPWLLLRATSNAGQGAFSQVRSIQRLHTVGGKAPAGGCGPAESGKVVRIPYSADYLFYR